MLSIAVCDDEMLFCVKLCEAVRGILDKMEIEYTIRSFYNGRELLEAVEQFDLIFLDLMMDGLDGMNTAKILRQRAFDKLLVFVSSSQNYVWDSYDVEPFWYLLKPVSEKKLERVIRRAVSKIEQKPQEFLVIRKDREQRKVFLKDILYVEVRGRIVEIYGREWSLPYYGKMSEMEKKLQGKGFFRCHKSILVNLSQIDSYNHQEAVLMSGVRLPIARRRYESFCQAFLQDMKKRGGIN